MGPTDSMSIGLVFLRNIEFCNPYPQTFLHGKNLMAKFSNSVLNPSLIQENYCISVQEKCPIDELHILEGITNHIFFDGLVHKIGHDS